MAARPIRERAIGAIAGVPAGTSATGGLRADLDVGVAASAVSGMVLTVALGWRTLQPGRPMSDVPATLMVLLRGRIANP